jgi:hypothetical protein
MVEMSPANAKPVRSFDAFVATIEREVEPSSRTPLASSSSTSPLSSASVV